MGDAADQLDDWKDAEYRRAIERGMIKTPRVLEDIVRDLVDLMIEHVENEEDCFVLSRLNRIKDELGEVC